MSTRRGKRHPVVDLLLGALVTLALLIVVHSIYPYWPSYAQVAVAAPLAYWLIITADRIVDRMSAARAARDSDATSSEAPSRVAGRDGPETP